ncbi:extracellular calcium-sensing receptor-like [Brienomyrus brachyistius]|uniref:extracellular calcium-sensing receptor-like n=1 Tax=Brienomyrus brachyistius TaxID=42636 RepID=UPI0020B28686|nr:extracellular calcium-sensing receptor-like [Brienomyrus brachyistius]
MLARGAAAVALLLAAATTDTGTPARCLHLGDFVLPAQEAAGDILIGGLFPLHIVVSEPELPFTKRPRQGRCSGFDFRAFRWLQTMVFAIEEINRDPDLLPGIQLGYRILDSCDHVHTGLRGALSLVNGSSGWADAGRPCLTEAPVPAIIGLASSSPTRAVAQTLGPFDIPLVSYFATCECLKDRRQFPSFLRTVPSDLFQVRGLVQLVAHFGWRWVGAIGTEDDYSRYGIQAFQEQLAERGGCLAFYATLPKAENPERLADVADALEASSARVILAFSTEGQLYGLLSEVARRNLTGHQWIASEAWVTASLLSGPQFRDTLAGTLGFAFRSASMPALGDFLLRVRPSPAPSSVFINAFWEELFGCRLDFTGGADEAPGSNQPSCSGAEDVRGRNSVYSDVSQLRVSYNVYKAVYAIAHALHHLLRCDGPGDSAGNRSCGAVLPFQPRQLLSYLKRVNFTTKFGEKVYFDSDGEPVPLYDIVNWQRDSRGNIKFKTVGTFDASAQVGEQLRMDQSTIVWMGGETQVPISECSHSCPPGTRQASRPREPICCFDCLPCADGEVSNQTGSTECMKCPQDHWSDPDRVACLPMLEEFLSFQDILGIVLALLSVLGIAMTLVVAGIYYRFRGTPIVRANNSELSFLLLVSLVLCFLCAPLFIGRPSPWSCWTRQATFGVAFVLCISCILAKTMVVLVAFRSTIPGSNAVRLFGPIQQRALIFSCTAVQVVLCVSWLTWDPPSPIKNTSYQAGQIILECQDGAILYLVLGYIGLLSCICFCLAFLGRKLPDTFNEAKLITFSMLIFFAVWISFIPAHRSSPGKYTVAVEIFAILASSFGLLLCIFLPKCFIILLKPEKNVKKGMVSK